MGFFVEEGSSGFKKHARWRAVRRPAAVFGEAERPFRAGVGLIGKNKRFSVHRMSRQAARSRFVLGSDARSPA
jgi:hypothetical protein